MTGRPKTGDEMFKIICEEISYIKEKYNVRAIGWVTDDGPDGKKARRLAAEDPLLAYLILLVCWAHQINLVFGDMLGIPWVSHTMRDAVEIVTWFNSHGVALELLREEQRISRPEATPLALLRPVQTRWTSHFSSCNRLLKLREDIQTCASRRRRRLVESVGTNSDSIAKVEQILGKICNNNFWNDLER